MRQALYKVFGSDSARTILQRIEAGAGEFMVWERDTVRHGQFRTLYFPSKFGRMGQKLRTRLHGSEQVTGPP